MTVECHQIIVFLLGIDVGYVLYFQWNDSVVETDYISFLIFLLLDAGVSDGLEQSFDIHSATAHAATCDSPFQGRGIDWLEQIIDASGFKCLESVAVVCCSHDDFGPDFCLTEYLKTHSVRKFHVHEYYVCGVAWCVEPGHSTFYGRGRPYDIHIREVLCQHSGKALLSHYLIFNNQDIHKL